MSRKGLDIPSLIGQQVEVLVEPGPRQLFGTPTEAARAVGVRVRLPAVVPPGLEIMRVEVEGEHGVRVTGDTRRLQSVLDALEINDVRPPAGLDGQTATVRMSPIVRVVYANANQEIRFLQSRSPDVTLPAGIDLPALGEIGLRIVGLNRGEAHTLARAIDWQSTLIVPVPAGVSSFRQVGVRGNRGLFVESTERRSMKAVIWSDSGFVYGITGALNNQTLLQMANSVQ